MKWNAELYDNKHSFVYQYGESVVGLLDPQPGERILDLGCGTGYLAQQIQDKGALVKGIDASADMVRQAKVSYPDINFSVADGTNFHFDEQFDAVFSNATLHWIKNADAMINCVYKALKPGGRFVAEMGGKGNIDKMLVASSKVLEKYGYSAKGDNNPWYFPSTAEYVTKLEAAGFRVTYTAHFDRPTRLKDGSKGVEKWLKMFGASFFEGIPTDQLKQIVKEITEILEPDYNKNGEWYADYKKLRFIAVKSPDSYRDEY